jgi:hypothetical protein
MNASVIASASVASRLEAALQSGHSTEQAIRDIMDICDSDADASWEVLSLLDQFYRRGRISDATFRVVNSQIQRFAVGGPAARAATRASLRESANADIEPPSAPAAFSADDLEPAAAMVPAETPRPFAAIAAQMFPGAAAPRSPPAHRAMAAGTVLADRYVLEATLDHGTTDTVYRALDRYRSELPLDEQRVAVKFPAGAEAHRRFFRAQALVHPNMVRLLECGRSGDLDFYTLEFQRGKLLRDVLREMQGPLQRRHALCLVRDIGAAVVYAHEHGVVHGALDTNNVLITIDGAVRVLNFDALPDQPADARHDLHALACIAYELLSGSRPFPGHDAISARQAGLKPKRPSGFSLRQWRALRQGLAWSSTMKPLAVKDWLRRLELERAAPALPLLGQLMTIEAPRRWSPVMTTVAVVSAVVAAAAVLTVVDLPGLLPRPAAPPAPALVPAAAAAVLPPANTNDSPGAPARIDTTPVPDASASSNDHPGRIGFAAESIDVPPDAPAARIVVRRTGGTQGDVGFSWWTENGSARAGDDYISLGTKQMLIPDGEDSVTLFVPLVAPGVTSGRSAFSVVLGHPTGGAQLAGISRLTVNLTQR